MVLLLSLAFALQADPAKELIEKLRSDSIEERETALQKLKAMGKAATPALKKAAGDPDKEVAAGVALLLRILELSDTLPARLQAASPGIAEALAQGDPRRCWAAFMELSKQTPEGGRAHPELTTADLEPLVPGASRGAVTSEEKLALGSRFATLNLRAAIPEMVRLLSDPDPLVGHSIGAYLQGLRAVEAVPQLLRLLKDPQAAVRSIAVETLQGMNIDGAVRAILPLLKDGDPGVRKSAVVALGDLGARETIPDLARLLKDEDPGVLHKTALALYVLDARDRIPELLALLKRDDASARCSAIEALGRMDAKEALPELLRSLEDEEGQVREAAMQALSRMNAREALPVLRRRAPGEHPAVREAMAEAFGSLHDEKAVPDLLRFLKDGDERLRRRTLLSLGVLKAKEAAPGILELLDSPDLECDAIEALGTIGAREAIPALLKRLTAKDDEVREAACLALARLGAREAEPAFLELARNEEDARRAVTGIHALQILGIGANPAPLLKIVRNEKTWGAVRSAAAEALFASGSKDLVPELIGSFKAVKDEEAALFQACSARILGALKHPPAIPLLIGALTSKFDSVRFQAMGALARMGARESIPALAACLGDGPSWIREAAADALDRLGAKEAFEGLERELFDEDPEVRASAALLLCRGGHRGAVPVLLEASRQDSSVSLFALNRLRRPELWRKLQERDCPPIHPQENNAPLKMEAWAGLRIDALHGGSDSWLTGFVFLSDLGVLHGNALQELQNSGEGDLLEADRIRRLHPTLARIVWERWWEEERRRGP